MGLEDVKKEILDNARKEAKRLISEAEKERKEILQVTENRIEELKAVMDREAKEQFEQYKLMMQAETQSKTKKERLAIEKEIFEEVFSLALEKLENSKEREKHIKTMLKNTQKLKLEKVYCSPKDGKLIKNWQKADIKGGIILENNVGDVRIDLSYETLLEGIKEEDIAEVAKVLF